MLCFGAESVENPRDILFVEFHKDSEAVYRLISCLRLT